MPRLQGTTGFEVSNSQSDFNETMIAAGRKIKLFGRGFKQSIHFRGESKYGIDIPARHGSVR